MSTLSKANTVDRRSPRRLTMPFISSPVTYPNSSPATASESRKRPNPATSDAPAKRRLLHSDAKLPPKHAASAQEVASRIVPTKFPAEELNSAANPFREVDSDNDDIRDSPIADCVDQSRTVPRRLSNSIEPEAHALTPGTLKSPIIACESSSGTKHSLRQRVAATSLPYERLVAQRSTTAPGKATKSYYGIDVHDLLDKTANNADKQLPREMVVDEQLCDNSKAAIINGPRSNMMWTEKYRARKFTDLVGDERTHRSVLGWVKGWDPVVFPGSSRPKPKSRASLDQPEERKHKKILLLTGPPGLGKTTQAHVCASQAGYEVVEINASDERSRDVVKGRIRDCLGTENVRGHRSRTGDQTTRRQGRPVCVVVDEVDGVVGGGQGGGEGGFMRALVDLVLLDQKNSSNSSATDARRKRKGDHFRILRPLILICNDLYHSSIRPLRSSGLAEIIHLRRPPLDKVIGRVRTVFEKEGFQADLDGVRRLCEATWGVSSQKDHRKASNTCEGDLRGILVVAEGISSRLRASSLAPNQPPRLTKQWVEKRLVSDLSCGGIGDRGNGRGSAKDVVERVFLEGAGFPKSLTPQPIEEHWTEKTAETHSSTSDTAKGRAISLLRNVLDTCGEHDRIVTDVFTNYPSRAFHDDTLLSKPNAAHDWLHFYDALSSKVFAASEWELAPYLSQAMLGFHHLFAAHGAGSWGANASGEKSSRLEDGEDLPFSGPRADFSAHEALKANRSILQSVQTSLSLPLLQMFGSPEAIAMELLPHLNQVLNPDVMPVVVGGGGDQRGVASVRRPSEKDMVRRAAEAMSAVGVNFERAKIEDQRGGYGGFVYRMEP